MALQEELEHQGNILFRYRSFLPVIILISGLVIYSHKEAIGQKEIANLHGNWYEYICFLISVAGLVIRVYIIGYTPKNTSGRNINEQVAGELNTTGLYSICRHPLYAGNLFMWMGLAMMTESFAFILIFCLTFWLYYERIMFAEEQFLRNKFGDTYLLWTKKTPTFIPNLKNWKKSQIKFSVKKVLRQEKTGPLALMFVFFIFHLASMFYSNKPFFPDLLFWTIGLLIALLIYLVIKIIETRTTILHDG